MKTMASIAAAVLVVAVGSATAHAGVNFNVDIGIPVAVAPAPEPVYYPPVPVRRIDAPQFVVQEPPRFIYSPDLGFYVSVDAPYDMVYMNRGYYLYNGGYWYLAPSYAGPWSLVPQRRLPPGLHRYRYQQIRQFRDREYRSYQHDREHYRGSWHQPERWRHDARPEQGRERWEHGRERWEHGRDGHRDEGR